MTESYFFDTYAIFEFIYGNPKYFRYSSCTGITLIFNLAELNHALKKVLDKNYADQITDDYSNMLVEVNLDDIKKAMSFRKKHHKLSAPDAIGYIVSKRLGIKFLTGDEGFKNLDNVEFIKK